MIRRNIVALFNIYENERFTFTSKVAQESKKPLETNLLINQEVFALLNSLVFDPSPKVRYHAILAVCRLTNGSEEGATKCLETGLVPKLLDGFVDKDHRGLVLCTVHGLFKHCHSLAGSLLNHNILSGITDCINSSDKAVAGAALQAFLEIFKTSSAYVEEYTDLDLVLHLMIALTEARVELRPIIVGILGYVAACKEIFARQLIENRCVPVLGKYLDTESLDLIKEILLCLKNIARHSVETAKHVVEANVLKLTLINLGHSNAFVRESAALLVYEVVRFDKLALLVLNTGGLAGLVYAAENSAKGGAKAAMEAVGCIASHSCHYANAAINSGALDAVRTIILSPLKPEDKEAALFAAEQISKHSSANSTRVITSKILPQLIMLTTDGDLDQEFRSKCEYFIANTIERSADVVALASLLNLAKDDLLLKLIQRLREILERSLEARIDFAASGLLKLIENVKNKSDSNVNQIIEEIHSCFPEDVVQYYSPLLPTIICEKITQFTRKPFQRKVKSSSQMDYNTENEKS